MLPGRGRVVFGILGTLTIIPISLGAQGSRPQLAGHGFVSSTLLPDPFIKTSLSTVVALGQAFDYQIAWPVLGDDTLYVAEGEMTWLSLDFDYRQRVTDWLAVGVQGVGGARVGTSAASAVADGVSVVTAFRVGGLASLARSNRLALSAHVDVSRSSVSLLNILGFAEDLIDSVEAGGSVDSLSISYKFNAWRGHGGLRMAFSPTPLLGLSAMANFAVGEEFVSLEDAFLDVDLGATLDFNLHSVGIAPLGLVVSYRFSTFADRVETSLGNSHAAVIGISYVGNEDFAAGLEVYASRIPLADGDRVRVAMTGIRMRYYF